MYPINSSNMKGKKYQILPYHKSIIRSSCMVNDDQIPFYILTNYQRGINLISNRLGISNIVTVVTLGHSVSSDSLLTVWGMMSMVSVMTVVKPTILDTQAKLASTSRSCWGSWWCWGSVSNSLFVPNYLVGSFFRDWFWLKRWKFLTGPSGPPRHQRSTPVTLIKAKLTHSRKTAGYLELLRCGLCCWLLLDYHILGCFLTWFQYFWLLQQNINHWVTSCQRQLSYKLVF